MRFLLALLFCSSAFAQTGATSLPPTGPKPMVVPIDWKCDFQGTRAGRVGTVIWAYCFGTDNAKTYARQRVILGGGITAQMESDATRWAKTGAPDVWVIGASTAIWDSAEAAVARAAMAAAIQAEKDAGTIPLPPQWRVLANSVSTTVPPTRPMFLASDVTKTAPERAYVGDVCNCAAQVMKGTQTLCPLAQLGDIAPTTNVTACVRAQ